MAKQLSSSPSNKKISELYKRVKEETLILQPDFQRKLVWSSKHKEAFIDTILKGMPFPEIYIAQSGIDIQKIETQEVVVDGQQRLSTIIQYIDEADDSKIFGKTISKFKDLDAQDKKDFLNYNVVIRDLEDVTPELIREVFRRINQTKFSLEQIEIQNAIYDGEFISTAKDILESVEVDHLPIFSDSEISRMSDLHFILSILSTIELGGYFSRDVEIEKMVAKFNDSYPNSNITSKRIIKILKDIKILDLPEDSIWYRKSNFFTLLVELYNNNDVNLEQLKPMLLQFESNVLQNKNTNNVDNIYSKYYSYMYTGTNSRQARVIRGKILSDEVLNKLRNLN